MRASIQKLLFSTSNFLLIAVVLSVLLFVIEYTTVMISVLNSEQSPDYVMRTASQYVSSLLGNMSQVPLAETLITMLVWGFTGLAVYTAFYLLANIWIDAQNEIRTQALNSVDGASTAEVLRQGGGKLILALLYILALGISLVYLKDLWTSLFDRYVYSGMETAYLPYLVAGLAGLSLNLYVLITGGYLFWKNNEADVAAMQRGY